LKGCIEYFLIESGRSGNVRQLLDGGVFLPGLHAFRLASVPFLLRFLQPSICLTLRADTGRYSDGVGQFEVCGLIYHCLRNRDWGDSAHFVK